MILEAHNLTKSFGTPPSEVIRGVSMEVKPGEFLALTGKSGSGKSTLLYLISSLDRPTSGSVLMDGQDFAKMSSKDLHRFRNRHIGFIFQFHYLLPEFSVLENVLMPAVKAGEVQKKRERAHMLLERFDLKDRLHHRPAQLSGGQAQRAAIARALLMEPDFVFADEPTGSLDSTNGTIVMDIFREISKGKTAVIFVTHDEDFARLARRQVHLKDGAVTE